jgi:flavoprotein
VNYGLTVYGPFEGEPSEVSELQTHLYDLLRATPRQAHTVVETMRAYSDFRTVTVAKRANGDLVVNVYLVPVDVSVASNCAFHARVSPQGVYA